MMYQSVKEVGVTGTLTVTVLNVIYKKKGYFAWLYQGCPETSIEYFTLNQLL